MNERTAGRQTERGKRRKQGSMGRGMDGWEKNERSE